MRALLVRLALGLSLALFSLVPACEDDGVGDECTETKECLGGLKCDNATGGKGKGTCRKPGDVPNRMDAAADAPGSDAAGGAAGAGGSGGAGGTDGGAGGADGGVDARLTDTAGDSADAGSGSTDARDADFDAPATMDAPDGATDGVAVDALGDVRIDVALAPDSGPSTDALDATD